MVDGEKNFGVENHVVENVQFLFHFGGSGIANPIGPDSGIVIHLFKLFVTSLLINYDSRIATI